MSDSRRRALLLVFVSVILGVLVAACGSSEGSGRRGENDGAAIQRNDTYNGLELEQVDAYTATFTLEFTAEGDSTVTWLYALDTVAGNSPPFMLRALSIKGASPSLDLGDMTLLERAGTQYLTGEATGPAGCLIFPADTSLEESLITPDDLLSPDALDGVLDKQESETVSGEVGTRYSFEEDELEEFANVAGDVVLADEGKYVLRYDFAADIIDTLFTENLPGRLTWHFEVTDFAPDVNFELPESCKIDLPVMADAQDLARLPGLITYTSPTDPAGVLEFYIQALAGSEWLQYRFPATRDESTILVFAKGGELLNISISPEDDGSEVRLFLEDREDASSTP